MSARSALKARRRVPERRLRRGQPRAAHVLGEQRTEQDECKDRGGAVQSDQPRFGRVGRGAEFSVHLKPTVQHPPRRAGDERRGEGAKQPGAVRGAEADAITLHGGMGLAAREFGEAKATTRWRDSDGEWAQRRPRRRARRPCKVRRRGSKCAPAPSRCGIRAKAGHCAGRQWARKRGRRLGGLRGRRPRWREPSFADW